MEEVKEPGEERMKSRKMRKQEEAAAKLNKVGDDSPSKHTRKRGGN